MDAINLLPKGIQKAKKEIFDFSSTVSFFLIISSIIISFFCYYKNQKYAQKIDSVERQANLIDTELTEKIKNSKKFLISENDSSNINLLLSEHKYYSNIIDFFDNIFIDNIFIESYSISSDKEFVNIDFEGMVKDYQSAATQIFMIKQIHEMREFSLNSLVHKGKAFDFSGNISFDKSIGAYQKNNMIQ